MRSQIDLFAKLLIFGAMREALRAEALQPWHASRALRTGGAV